MSTGNIFYTQSAFNYSLEEFYALKTIFKQTHGPNWLQECSWGHDIVTNNINFCTWAGIGCSCLSDCHVSTLNLTGCGLQGNLPSSLSYLSQLQTLSLSNNYLSGPLPTKYSSFDSLVTLDLSYNHLTHTIPMGLGILPSLEHLDLSSNQLSGPISLSLGSLSNLRTLSLASNALSRVIPCSFNALTTLEELDVSHNMLIGPLPSFEGFNRLRSLNLSINQISQQLPACSKLPSLRSLDVSGNDFSQGTDWTCDWLRANSSRYLNIADNQHLSCLSSCLSLVPASQLVHSAVNCPPLAQQTSQTLIIVSVISAVLGTIAILLSMIIYLRWFYETPETKLRRLRLQELPVHSTLLALPSNLFSLSEDKQRDVLAPFEQLLSSLASCKSLSEEDYDGRTALTILLTRLNSEKWFTPPVPLILQFISLVLAPLVSNHDPKSTSISDSNSKHHPFTADPSNDVWVSIVQCDHYLMVRAVDQFLQTHKSSINRLSFAKDRKGRICRDVACEQIRRAINKRLFLHGRFDLVGVSPEHKSPTSLLILCPDRKAEVQEIIFEEDQAPSSLSNKFQQQSIHPSQIFEIENHQSEDNDPFPAQPGRVALKFIRSEQQFNREVMTRKNGNFDSKYVMGILWTYSPSSDPRFHEDSLAKGFGQTDPFCLVMEAGEQNLKSYIDNQDVVGKDLYILSILRDLLHATHHVHCNGFIHGDLKPRNVIVVKGKFKLIDFDASVPLGNPAGSKFSSAYIPPEMLSEGPGETVIVRVPADADPTANSRSSQLIDPTAQSYTPVLASPSFDVWSLGALLFLLCTGSTLFNSDVNDNIPSTRYLLRLMSWTSETRLSVLQTVINPIAKNLLFQILVLEPSLRLSIPQILSHPYLDPRSERFASSSRPKPSFEIFLSYRVWSDHVHVQRFYELLVARGLKVWLDEKCLEDGQNWEEGFCHGLVDSLFFVPFFSKKGLSNFSALTSSSPCDNVFLEHRLALELKEMGVLKGVFPIVIGEEVDSNPPRMKVFYGPGGWIPECRDESVSSVEQATLTHLTGQGLGTPLHPSRSVLSVMSEMKKMQGALIDGDYDERMREAADRVLKVVRHAQEHPDPTPT